MNRPENAPGHVFAIAGASGTGKTTICRLLEERGLGVFSVSHTTRKKSDQEVDGRDYFFIDEDEFRAMLERDEMLESAVVHNHLYGTSRKWVLEQCEQGLNVLLEIDVQGCRLISDKLPRLHTVFVLPPSYEELEKRLLARKREGPHEIQKRLEHSLVEMTRMADFDYIVVNEDLDSTLEKIVAIVRFCLGDQEAGATSRLLRAEAQQETIAKWTAEVENRLKSAHG